jgi:hypothetical protein
MTTTPSVPRQPGWFVVTQVKSNRVVYFTDDPDFRPAMEGDWYFVSHFFGDIPEDITLTNCWGWRFDGTSFEDVRGENRRPPLELLLESNRAALLGLLRDKIDLARAALAPSCRLGEEARRLKLEEARRFQAHRGGSGESGFPFLEAVAVARNVSLAEAASIVEARHRDVQHLLESTEAVRERYTQAILAARAQDDLLRLRRELLDEVLPSLTRNLVFPVKVFEPEDRDKPLSEDQRVHEVARLQVQLREIINVKRQRVRSQYFEDETLRRRKATLAQAVLSNAGRKPDGLDCSLLESYAQAHRLSLGDAARLILGAMTEAEQILVRTELMKDSMLARIEGVKSLRDVRRAGADLRALAEDRPPTQE